MEKVIRDGEVAILYSPGFGAGWYSWNTYHKQLLFHPKLVALVESNQADLIDEDWMLKELGIEHVYCGGAAGLTIRWLPEGAAFNIDEYDGSESIMTLDDITLIA